jgi:hypothetical protein
MNLYKIIFSHHAPKDSEVGIKCLLLADNDEKVYEWISSEPETKEGTIYNSWEHNEAYIYNDVKEIFEDEDGYESPNHWYDEDSNPEDFKTRMLRLNGEINDEDYDFSDAYYGITLYGWELLKKNVTTDYSELKELGIIYTTL